nr:YheC/YheD family protein [Neobacillus sp. Marseille-Q6967]
MESIGLLHHRKHPADVKKAYPFAAAAKMEDIPFFYFSFNSVDFENMKIKGWRYEEGKWIQEQMDFPAVVINSGNPKNEAHSKVLKQLKKHTIFTSYPVGNKMKVYNKIKRASAFASYLIPSKTLHQAEDAIPFLEEHANAVIKPLSGNHGKKVMFIERIEIHYKITEGNQVSYFTEKEMIKFISHQIHEQKFMIQPFIECKTKNGLAFDFRLHVQKNGEGMWEKTLIYPRISGSSKLISNISSGGYRGELDPFLKDEFGDQSNQIKEMLENFAIRFPSHFDTLYEHSFDELGIDVGIDSENNLWIFEVNWRPGSKNREFDVARRLIPYCKFLINQKNK